MRTVQTEQKTKWTAEAYFAWSRPDDGNLYEVIDGELIPMASPILIHQTMIFNLCGFAFAFLRRNRIGRAYVSPVDVMLGQTVVIPDFVYVRNDQQHLVEGGKRIMGAPAFVVEVLSLSTGQYDWTKKKALYEKHGVEEYWLIDPILKQVEVWLLNEGEYLSGGEFGKNETIRSQVIEGFEFVVSELFV